MQLAIFVSNVSMLGPVCNYANIDIDGRLYASVTRTTATDHSDSKKRHASEIRSGG